MSDLPKRELSGWEDMLDRMRHPVDEVTIGIIGKYVDYEDSYKSLKEALLHAGLAHQLRVQLRWVEAEGITQETAHHQLSDLDGILVPGGFGIRGIDGMLEAIRYAREQKVPYFGICLGMQTMVIEYGRNVCWLERAHSTEFDPGTPVRLFFKLRELKGIEDLGGNMRLGSWPCKLEPNSLATKAYGSPQIHERHRHRYEFNRDYEEVITSHGMRVTGETPDAMYVEICELPDHPWYLGCQFHPEFKSKPLESHPLFSSFVGAAFRHRGTRVRNEQVREAEQFLRVRVS